MCVCLSPSYGLLCLVFVRGPQILVPSGVGMWCVDLFYACVRAAAQHMRMVTRRRMTGALDGRALRNLRSRHQACTSIFTCSVRKASVQTSKIGPATKMSFGEISPRVNLLARNYDVFIRVGQTVLSSCDAHLVINYYFICLKQSNSPLSRCSCI
jgi:hypothetical protein